MRTRKWSWKFRKYAAMLICLLLCVSMMRVPAFADTRDGLDSEKKANLTLQYEMSGVSFALYRVAEVSSDGTFTLTGDFVGYPVEINGLDSAGWRALAETLAGYVDKDQIAPYRTGVTDEGGRIAWTGLQPGLYLVLGEEKTEGRVTYTPAPSMVALPTRDEQGCWEYDVVICPKSDMEETPDEDTEKIKVIKIWKDYGHKEYRPQVITVELYQDGVLYDTVKLSKANNWKYAWTDLPVGHHWTAVEKDISGHYYVTVVREGKYLVITNYYKPDQPDETETPSETESSSETEFSSEGESSSEAESSSESDTPYETETPAESETPYETETPAGPETPYETETPAESEIPSETESSAESEAPSETESTDESSETKVPLIPTTPHFPGGGDGSGLPQTGQLWWPVPVLTLAGIAAFTIGWIRRRERERSHDSE
ncbi:MAG: Cna B-type domain-containing protein [Lachnospiraceae bacterium]|nr:Cna B-type domain-containing protein [Lachnospiraceae bacterium]